MRLFRDVAVTVAMTTAVLGAHLSAQSSAFSLVWSPSGRLRFERPFSWTEMKSNNPNGIEQVQVQGGYKGHGHAVWVTVMPMKAIAGAGDCSASSHLQAHIYFATNTFQAGPNRASGSWKVTVPFTGRGRAATRISAAMSVRLEPNGRWRRIA